MKVDTRKHAEAINRVLFRISNAINTTKDLDQLYASIHHTLGRIIDVTNFYIALYDSEKRTLRFPYFRDQKEDLYGEIVVDYDISDSLTGQVIIDQQPVLLGKKELIDRKSQNRLRGTVPLAWLGVPLLTDNSVIGVMAVQSYTDPYLFNQNDADVLASVSQQIALAIDRKVSQEALIESERRFREIADLLPTILCELDRHLRVTYINRIGTEVFGITPDDLALGFEVIQLFYSDDADRVAKLLDGILKGNKTAGVEQRLMKKDQEEMVALVYSSPIVNAGEVVGARLNITDITPRKRAEEQRDKLISELQETLAEVKILKGIIPICASCKKIRDDKGYWNQVESYIGEHSEAEFSHGICPECVKTLYPELGLRKKK